MTRRSDNTHPTVQAAVLGYWNQAPALFDLPVETETQETSLAPMCRNATNLPWRIKTFDSPLYLIPLMNFRKFSKAGLNAPIYMTNTVRFQKFTYHCPHQPHLNASPQSEHPTQPAHRIYPQPWTCWNTCLSWSVRCAAVKKKRKKSKSQEADKRSSGSFVNCSHMYLETSTII